MLSRNAATARKTAGSTVYVVSRTGALQREQLAVLKAFGYTNRALGVHYLKLVLRLAVVGAVLCTGFVTWAVAAPGGV